MVTIRVAGYDDWRGAARLLLSQGVSPDEVMWMAESADASLPFAGPDIRERSQRDDAKPTRVPRRFAELAELASCHRSAGRWDLLYRVLWRIEREGRHVLDHDSDPEVRALGNLAGQVRRDEHKMRAFVRFTPVEDATGTRYVAWYEPDHLIVRRAAPFFADRFASLAWSILTPDESAHWDGKALSFTAGVDAPMIDASGEVGELWRVYYEAIFNPARLNPRAMLREMPLRRWRALPEAPLIPHLVSTAGERTQQLDSVRVRQSARPFVPDSEDLEVLRRAVPSCRGCRLHAAATQAVFGEGRPDARIVLVGEQPGDAEDLAGRPFVGPAGQVLDRALAAASVDRREVYLTNAVKHFSWEPRGKRRIHQTPRLSEMHACRPWLEAELRSIRAATVVAMGATAARSLLGPQAQVMALRGRVLEGFAWAPRVIVTLHPSAVLRSQEQGGRYFDMLVADLRLASGAASNAA